MIRPNQYEELNFGNEINIISQRRFPNDYPLHWHREIELLVYPDTSESDSTPELEIQGQRYHMSPGDIMIIWQGELHQTISNPDRQLIGIQFSPTLLTEAKDFDPFRNQMRTIHQFSYQEHPELLQNLQMYAKNIVDLQAEKPTFFRTDKIISLWEFFMCIARALEKQDLMSPEIQPHYSSQTAGKIQEACVYITMHLEDDISLDQISEHAGFSPSYFSRVFKQITNQNFVEYLLAERVKHAQILLSDPDLPITEIAYHSGFKSIPTFNRVFRQIKGCSPSEYRKYLM
ncbi:MAG: helix-turn-helix transcriptional regulator [Lachnospiraceae bacterium]|nr:helix-turn-helix transcriptional regulator [Lachnospiraceae bacterium]